MTDFDLTIIKTILEHQKDNIEDVVVINKGMSNGDVIKAIFPCSKYNEYFADVEMKTEENDTRFKSVFDRDWWDETYQKGGTNEE